MLARRRARKEAAEGEVWAARNRAEVTAVRGQPPGGQQAGTRGILRQPAEERGERSSSEKRA